MAGGGVDGQHITFIFLIGLAFLFAMGFERGVALQDLEVEATVMEHWTAGERPQEREASVIFLHIAFPLGFPLEGEGGEIAGACEEDDALAVRSGRGTGEVASVVTAEAIGHWGAPFQVTGFGVEAEGDDFLIFFDGGGQVDGVADDDGRATGGAGQ